MVCVNKKPVCLLCLHISVWDIPGVALKAQQVWFSRDSCAVALWSSELARR